MGDYLAQIGVFLLGIVIQLYTQILSAGKQKKAFQVFAVLLIVVALVWTGYQLALREMESQEDFNGVVIDTPDDFPRKTPTPIRVTPDTTGGDSVWVNSYPIGASVYIAPATVSLDDLKVEDLRQTANLVGMTPLTLELPAGNYYVLTFFTAELYAANGYELPVYSSPTYRNAFPSDGSLIRAASFSDGENIKDISRVYRLSKEAFSPETLISIALPLPEEQRDLTMPYVYPTLDTVRDLPESYSFTPYNVQSAIEISFRDYNLNGTVNTNMVDEMLQTLSRVGKVVLETESVRIIIQLSGYENSKFTVTVYQ